MANDQVTDALKQYLNVMDGEGKKLKPTKYLKVAVAEMGNRNLAEIPSGNEVYHLCSAQHPETGKVHFFMIPHFAAVGIMNISPKESEYDDLHLDLTDDPDLNLVRQRIDQEDANDFAMGITEALSSDPELEIDHVAEAGKVLGNSDLWQEY